MNALNFNLENHKVIVSIMDTYGKNGLLITGENAEGESVVLSVGNDIITTETAQHNGWIRVNTYHRDGTREETYKR